MLPKVSVIIAARNEEKVIGSTLSHLTKVDYPKDKLEIFVVVDGSSDRTAEIARSFPDVKVIEQKEPRRCKAEALNAVIPLTTGEIIAVFDADAIVHPCAIRAAVKHFENEKVLAVTGPHESYKCNDWVSKASAVEASIRNFAVEFANKLNFDAALDGSNLYVRKRILEAIGMFDTETMLEDLTLTINISTLKDREKIIYEPKAVVYQQEPNGVRNFMKQRYRWARGFLRVLKKYKHIDGIKLWIFVFLLLIPISSYYTFFTFMTIKRGRAELKKYVPYWITIAPLYLFVFFRAMIHEQFGKDFKWFKTPRV